MEKISTLNETLKQLLLQFGVDEFSFEFQKLGHLTIKNWKYNQGIGGYFYRENLFGVCVVRIQEIGLAEYNCFFNSEYLNSLNIKHQNYIYNFEKKTFVSGPEYIGILLSHSPEEMAQKADEFMTKNGLFLETTIKFQDLWNYAIEGINQL